MLCPISTVPFVIYASFVSLFRPGLGVLVRRGTYWYPGRLIDCPGETEIYDLYYVRLWRDCQFDETAREMTPSLDVNVPPTDIVDCLYKDKLRRRRIRVCHLIRARRSFPDMYTFRLENTGGPACDIQKTY